MRTIIIAILNLFILSFMPSCNLQKQVPQYLAKHNFVETHTLNPVTGETKFHASIETLYDTSKVAEMCSTADVCLHISQGSVVVDADCRGMGEKVYDVIKKLVSKIQFK